MKNLTKYSITTQYIILKMETLKFNSQYCPLGQVYFPVHRTFVLGSLLWNIALRECTVKYCPPRERNTENKLFQYYPNLKDNTEMNHNDNEKIYTMSILGQNAWYRVKYTHLLLRVFLSFALRNSLRQRAIFDSNSLVSS